MSVSIITQRRRLFYIPLHETSRTYGVNLKPQFLPIINRQAIVTQRTLQRITGRSTPTSSALPLPRKFFCPSPLTPSPYSSITHGTGRFSPLRHLLHLPHLPYLSQHIRHANMSTSPSSRPSIVCPDSGPEPPYPLRMEGEVISGFGRGSKEVRWLVLCFALLLSLFFLCRVTLFRRSLQETRYMVNIYLRLTNYENKNKIARHPHREPPRRRQRDTVDRLHRVGRLLRVRLSGATAHASRPPAPRRHRLR